MLESQICLGCGHELRGVAAPPDPVYGLPVVVCSRCSRAVVRRRHRLRPWAQRRRWLGLGLSLMVRAAAAALAVLTSLPIVSFAVQALNVEVTRTNLSLLWGGMERNSSWAELASMLVGWAALLSLPVICGGMLGLLQRHWPVSWLPVLMAGPSLLSAGLFLLEEPAWAWPQSVALSSGVLLCWFLLSLGSVLYRVLVGQPRPRVARGLRRARRRRLRRYGP
jgi:hypothetical protein